MTIRGDIVFSLDASPSIDAEHGEDADWNENISGQANRHESDKRIKLFHGGARCYGQTDVSDSCILCRAIRA